ncbi:MAG: DUF2087 domain-containing protein [Anaerolineae bacterium]|nr:DUF2087 domain-containing protein [Anaerolineae bacterium]MCO5206668.1 DUF2087 domain-containing protein [Anaerolineae bacterium]
MPHITEAEFRKRFVPLILGGRQWPKKERLHHILYISALQKLEPDRTYSVEEINLLLGDWSERFGDNFGLDHVTLRRALIDAQYLQRDRAGTVYTVDTENASYTYDASIRAIDLDQLVADAIADNERRKRQYAEQQSGEQSE